MRKFYSLVALAMMSLFATSMQAQTMTEENPTLDQMGYRLEKDVDFAGGTVNGKEIVPGDALSFGPEESYKINGWGVYKLLNEGLEFMSVQLADGQINLVQGTGLRSTKNERWIVVNDLRVGQIVAVELSREDSTAFVVNSIACNGNTGWEDTPSDPIVVEPISGSIHELQDLAAEKDEEGNYISGAPDKFRYFKVIEEGPLCIKFNGKSANILYRMQIWSDKNDAEAVSTPSLKVIGVNNDARKIEFKAGVSTLGNETKTYYSIDGSDPIFMKETDEIIGYDYIYGEDGEKEDSVPVYKKVLDADLVAEVGDYGDIEYNPEDGFISVSASDDAEDGAEDGNVTIKAASVSIETGAVSNVVTIIVPVGEIALNEPTLSLSGMEGTKRTYSVAWTNNTLCGEDYQFILSNDEGYYEELDQNVSTGITVSGNSVVTVSVKVEGYKTAVAEKEVDAKGIDVNRKASVVADEDGNAVHDWDFVKITDEQKQIIRGEVIESCYILVDNGETVDSLVYSAEEYLNGEANDGTDLSVATPNYAPSCWWWDGSRTRATLNVANAEEGYEGNISDLNANGYGYVDDTANIFNGLGISCPPNASNNSCIFMYINDDLGAYFMARPTITFPREAAAAGEYVMFYIGQGGSNFTNSRWATFYEVPTGELLSVTLPSGGVHVFYIDVYTYDNLPADEYDPTSVKAPMTSGIQKIAGYYSINGARLAAPQKGINIVKYADGTTMKVLVK